MAEQHKPGEKIQTSGIYMAVKEGDGGSGFEVTCVSMSTARIFRPRAAAKVDKHYE
ncbi:conserved hypothetical protein [Paraburkholderia piptadeniae]|uniref:Uncharacterized protein n=1 Tax=Paraburkholderia piptadeniae TaxID=1701573 RepID=A0A1N7SE57_9BURK|nr:hypothetical protein [Paraburkholderia piptadeniae]SIT45708.1 conserved hypothetical protein [Paraburkholderia piptadeniae]